MRKTAMIVMVALAATASLAHECKPPKRISCERAKQIVGERCPPEPVSYEHKWCRPGDTCTDDTCDECTPCPKAEPAKPVVQVRTEYILTEVPAPSLGAWLLAGGPMYHDSRLGATVVGGYEFASGWVVLGGPTWQPQDGTKGAVGTVSNCNTVGGSGPGDNNCRCVTLPWATAGAQARSAWGVQALVGYRWGRR